MSEKGLERETEGISVGEREPVVADSSPKGGRLRSSWKKLWKGRKRKALALLLVVAIAGGVVIWRGRGQTASAATTYQEAAVERRSITNSLSSSGTLEPADSYTVNTLVSGEILSDTFEKGDQVEEGQLLYTIDSSNAASSQTQAQMHDSAHKAEHACLKQIARLFLPFLGNLLRIRRRCQNKSHQIHRNTYQLCRQTAVI